MSYRPICDSWLLCRPKVKYYGAYPSGFLHRARQLLGVSDTDPVLHVCAGMIRKYPFRGLGVNDKTLDLNPLTKPDFLEDAREPFPLNNDVVKAFRKDRTWDAVLIDRPYTDDDADKYIPWGLREGHKVLPPANLLIKNAITVLPIGGKVGMLDYVWPQPPKNAKEVAVVAVYCGRNGRARVFTVFERLS
jgi:hypothetical protein